MKFNQFITKKYQNKRKFNISVPIFQLRNAGNLRQSTQEN